MASRKRPVTFSIDIALWEQAQLIKEKTGLIWSDVVSEAISKVVDAMNLALENLDNPDLAYDQLTQLTKTNYLDSLALISEHQVKPEVKAPEVKVSRTKVKK